MAGTGVTNVEVDRGSHEHKVLVTENVDPKPTVQDEEDSEDETVLTNGNQRPRKRPSNPVNVQVGPTTGGLIGLPATLANLSAVGFVLVLLTMMYMDFRSSVKEERAAMREENRLTREANNRTDSAMIAALEKQTSAIATQNASMNAALNAVQVKMDSLALLNQSLISEMKTDTQLKMTKLDEVIKELRTANGKKP
jgi:hypothetical protein